MTTHEPLAKGHHKICG